MSNETDTAGGSLDDVGSRLRSAREAKNISLRDIANTTKISVSALEALEQNDVKELPGGIFTRAFLRSYASEVGLDPEETVRDFMSQIGADKGSDEARYDAASACDDQVLFLGRKRMVLTVFWVVVLGMPLAGLLLLLGMNGRGGVLEEIGTEVPEVRALVSTIPASPRGGTSEGSSSVTDEQLEIVLRPTGDCWVSLTIDGEEVFARVMRAGEEEAYRAASEIVINVGDAGAFEFWVNGQAGRSLGDSGEVVNEVITRRNYRNYLAR